MLIEKYVKNYRGLQKAFLNEYRFASNTKNGLLDWRKVMPQLLRYSYGNSYINAIQTVGPLVRSARRNHQRSGNSKDDRDLFDKIDSYVELLVSRRVNELKPIWEPIKGWVLWKGNAYKNHETTIKAWQQFRSDAKYDSKNMFSKVYKMIVILLIILLIYFIYF